MLFLYLYNSVAYRNTSSPILTDWAFLMIIRTGKTLGRHFDLLDDVQATVLFKVFFGQALIELDQQLMAAVKVIQSGIRG